MGKSSGNGGGDTPLLRPFDGGFTLVEIIVTMVVISVLAVVAIVAINSSMNSFKFSGATAKVISDIRYAQHLARTRNGWYGIGFSADPANSYNVYSTDGTTDADVSNPANTSQPLVINLSADYRGVTISAVNIAGGNKVEFNPLGVPHNDKNGNPLAADGTVTLSLGGANQVVRIIKGTGKVELQ